MKDQDHRDSLRSGVTSLVTSDLEEIPVDGSGMWQPGRCLLAGKSYIRVSPSTTLLYVNYVCLLNIVDMAF